LAFVSADLLATSAATKGYRGPSHGLIDRVGAISKTSTLLDTRREALADPPLKFKELAPASETPQGFNNTNWPEVVDLAVKGVALPILFQRHSPHRDE